MAFTFQKFSDPQWGYERAFGQSYVPDEIYAPVLNALKSRAADTLAYEGVIRRAELMATRRQTWAWPDTMNFVSGLWHRLDPVRGEVFVRAVDAACIKVADMPPGKGGGSCGPNFIDFQRDLTLNDPVYLAHESGHLIAALMAPDPDNYRLPWNMVEIPAYFMQEHAYDSLRLSAATDEARHAIDLHRLSDYTGVLMRIPFGLWALDQQKSREETPSLRTIFAEWSVQDNQRIENYERWARADDQTLDHKAQMIHTHPLSSLLMIELYQRFKRADQDVQKHMLGALYDRGAEASLVDTLAVFGVKTQDDLRQAAGQACGHLAREIRRYGFKTPPLPSLIVG